MCIRQISLLLLTVIFLYGCTPATLNLAEDAGKSALDAREIFNLVSGNTMELSAYDFSGRVYFDKSGRMSAVDNEQQLDSGIWDISEENRLCMKFRLWYYGDLKCYSILRGAGSGSYRFFTTNGAAYYTGSQRSGDPTSLAQNIPAKKSDRYLRQEFSSEPQGTAAAPAASTAPAPARPDQSPASSAKTASSDSAQSVRRLARNCPGCNLAGADLKEIELINANLSGADLSRADLRYSNLRRANLAGADLSSARLNHANLPGANLKGCSLRNADLRGANLLLADLTGADLTGANLEGAYLENTKGIEK